MARPRKGETIAEARARRAATLHPPEPLHHPDASDPPEQWTMEVEVKTDPPDIIVKAEMEVGRIRFGSTGGVGPVHAAFKLIADHIESDGSIYGDSKLVVYTFELFDIQMRVEVDQTRVES